MQSQTNLFPSPRYFLHGEIPGQRTLQCALDANVYKFSIPWFIQTSKAWKKRNLAVESGDSSQDTPTSSSSNPITPTISLPAMEKNLPTVGSYGPYNFDIPTDLLPYVPPGHLYVNKKAKKSKIIPPGSPEWIDKIKVIQQEYETYYELLKIAEDQKGGRLKPCSIM
ncbi:unnamed protein product [Rhizophagus irregularis]|uniref:Uncharacterized protein n=1 Tax=Rhizophagus irregularis TaxID=588596 RepID=A0A916EL97_9GLOM|nr:unnamed protein product [Rhizophagus irregularis]